MRILAQYFMDDALKDIWEDQIGCFPALSMDDEVMGGEPCIAGTRIPVSVVVSMMAEGYTLEEVAESYCGAVSVEQAKEAILFAARLTYWYGDLGGRALPVGATPADVDTCVKCKRSREQIAMETGQKNVALYALRTGDWCYECLTKEGDK